MKIFTIKLILARSNPQIIRELQIEDTRTVEQLQDAAKTVFLDDPESCTSVVFRMDEQSVSPKKILADVLKPDIFAKIQLNQKNQPVKTIHLEVLQHSSIADFSDPCVTRFRPDCASLHLAFFASEAEKRYKEHLAKMNRELIRLFHPDAVIPELCKAVAIPLADILNSYTVADLTEMANYFNLYYSSGKRKSVLVDTICEEMNVDDYWNSVLASLDYSEYQAMRTLCINGHLPDLSKDYWDVLPKLTERGLIARDSSGVTRVAKEFMEFYERWLESNSEPQFLLKLCYRTALKAAGLLYGFVDRKLAEELMLHCYPDISKNVVLAPLWASETTALIPDFRLLNATAYYDARRFDLETAEQLFMDFIKRNRLHYIPDQTMLEYVASRGYRLDPPVENAYRAILNQYHCTPNQIRYSVDEVATLTYYQYKKTDILARCSSTLRLSGNSPLRTSIKHFLEVHEHNFRQLPLYGFTPLEMQTRLKKVQPITKKKTVYPNDPCPCGSGKKYKLCCGRK